MNEQYEGAIKVTISDPDTGKVLEERIVRDEYVLVTAGIRYLKSIQIWGRTHMLAVAVRKPGEKVA